MNKIILSGRLTADVELRTTESGVFVASFSLAVRRPHVKDTTDFVSCTAWRQSAEFISKFASKGTQVGVAGCLTSRDFTDKNGASRRAWEVQCDDVEILESKKSEGAESSGGAKPKTPYVPSAYQDISDSDEDLPF